MLTSPWQPRVRYAAVASRHLALPAPLLLALLLLLPGGSLEPQGPDPLALVEVPPTVLGSALPPVVYGDRSRGWYAVELLPEGGVALAPDSFQTAYDLAGVPRDCDERTALSGSINSFGLPLGARNFSLLALLGLPRRDLSAPGGAVGEVLSLGGLRVQWDAAVGTLLLTAGWDVAATLSVAVGPNSATQLRFPSVFSTNPAPPIALAISRRDDGALAVCVNGSPAKLMRAPGSVSALGAGWLAGSSLSSGWSLERADAVQLGDPAATTSVSARLHQAWLVAGAAWSCADVARMMPYTLRYTNWTVGAAPLPPLAPPLLAAPPYANEPPRLVRMGVSASDGGTGAEGEAFVGQNVTVVAEVADADGDAVRVRMTWYGVPARGCTTSGCGNQVFSAQGNGSALLSATAAFQLPGRYTVRLEASDLAGLVVAWDAHVLVRKLGDTQRRAACCRSTGMVVAGQAGRPIHSTRFRDPLTSGLALGLGWPADNLAAEDLEAERLFDYSLLAPAHNPGGLQLSTCLDAYLAGPGSPRVLSGSAEQARVTGGHGKRMLIVPQGFDWGAAAAEKNKSEAPACESHWTKWPAGSQYRKSYGTLPDGSTSYCSFACTRNGTQALRQLTGMTDRLAEIMVELSYGRLSYSWDVTVTDTLSMPVNSSTDAFFYSDMPVAPFLQRQGISRAAFHTTMMLSPAPPPRINPGYTAWSAVGAGSMYVMRCAPQLYYLVHEVGHLLGLPHANIWRLDNATRAPTDPSGPGSVQDGYSDKLDMMACCRGDYGALSRTWLGWLPFPERRHIMLPGLPAAAAATTSATASPPPPPAPPPPPPPEPPSAPPTPSQSLRTAAPSSSSSSSLSACSPSASPTGCPYTLWPLDRAESRGRLKALTVRLSEDALLVLSYKSMPWWQDVRLGRQGGDRTAADRESLVADEMRSPLTGLSVEYMRLRPDPQTGRRQWGDRSLLDFNTLFGEWPSALPQSAGALPLEPARSAFALLREGQAWLHASGLLLVAQAAVGCDGQAEVPVYNYTAPNFYGFRGEYPGSEAWDRADYSGYAAGLSCLRVVVRTRALARPGKLSVRLRVAGADSGLPLDLRGSCGFPLLPRLQLHLGAPYDNTTRRTAAAATGGGAAGTASADAAAAYALDAAASGADVGLPAGIAAVVWRDPMNVTFASGTLAASLPPFSDRWVREASTADSPQCASGCDATYRVRVAAYDGAQVLVSVRVAEVSLSYILLHVSYRHYLPDDITTDSELLYVPVLPPWAPASLPNGAAGPAAAAGAPPGSSGGGTAAQRVADGPVLDATAQAAVAGASAAAAWPQAAAGPGDGAWGLQLVGDLYGSRAVNEQPAARWSARQLPASGCSGQWSLTLLLKMAIPDRDGRWAVAAVSLAPGGTAATNSASGDGAAPQLGVWLVRNSSSAFTGKNTGPSPSRLALSLVLGLQQEARVSLPDTVADAAQHVYHVAIVYDQGRLGAWVDGGGAWHWRDAACAPPRAGATYCSRATASPSAADGASNGSDGAAGVRGGLDSISLLGGGPGLGALLLSARAYNYALPRADFGAEATCLGDGTCSARFGLRSAPPPSAGDMPVGGSADAAAAVMGAAGPGGTASIAVPDQPGWDLLAAAAAAFNTTASGAAGYTLQVGDWSECSASCGGGVAVRLVACYRATLMGPWPVSRDDCPLARLPTTVVPCNQQLCPPRAAVLMPAPGPSACAAEQLQAACQQQQARQLLQPICLRADGLPLPLRSCAAVRPRPNNATAAGPSPPLEEAPQALPPLLGALDGPVGVAAWDAIGLSGVLSAGDGPASQLKPVVPGGSGGGGDVSTVNLSQALASGALRPLCPAAAAAPASCTGGRGARTGSGTVNGSSASSLAAAEATTLGWALGPWGPCSAQCGAGGTRTRIATCTDSTAGSAPRDAAACERALGPVPPSLLSGPCGTGQPCSAARWRVGPWSACEAAAGGSSALGLGSMRRSLECVDAAGAPTAASLCAGLASGRNEDVTAGAGGLNSTSAAGGEGDDAVLASVLALAAAGAAGSGGRYVPARAAECWEAAPFAGRCMAPLLAASERPCFGNGACTYAGCVCYSGFAGQLCEVRLADPADPGVAASAAAASTTTSCPSGIMDRAGACCGSGLLSANGTCCTAPSGGAASAALALDAAGGCCAGPVDACGVCGGSGVAVDAQGVCCSTLLDQHGLCCAAGRTDECGVCGGDGTSCALRLQLRLQLRPGATGAAGPDTAALSRLLLLGVGPAEGALALSLQGLAGPVAAGAAEWLLATYDVTYGSNVGDGTAAAAAVMATETTATSPADGASPAALSPLAPYTFTTTAVGLRLQGLGAALLALSPAASTLPAASSGAPGASSRALGAHRRSAAGAPGDDGDEAEAEGGPGGGGVLGLLHAGDVVALAVQVAGAAAAAFRQAVWPRRELGTPPNDGSYDAVGGSGPTAVEPEPTTSTDAFHLRHQSGGREPHADGFWGASLGPVSGGVADVIGGGGPSEPSDGRRRQALAVRERIQQGQRAAASGAVDGAFRLPLGASDPLGVRAGRRRRLHEDAGPLLPSLPTNSGSAPLQAATSRRARARNHTHLLAQPQLFSLSAALQERWQPLPVLSGATSLRLRSQQQQQEQQQQAAQRHQPAESVPSAPGPANARVLIAGSSPAGTATAAPAAAAATPEQQAAALALAGSPDALRAVAALGLLGLEVVGMERVGLCGNGVCEVGERPEAAGAAGCPGDCPAALRPAACPAGSSWGLRGGYGGGGADMRQCSGRGACLTGPGACACHTGYLGDACDECAPGFWRAAVGAAAGTCVRQYIRGRTLPEWDALGSHSTARGVFGSKVALICIIAGSGAVSVLVLASLAAFVWRSGLLQTKARIAAAPTNARTPALAASPGRAAAAAAATAAASKKKGSRSSRVAPTPHASRPAAAPWTWSLLRPQLPDAAGGGAAAAGGVVASAAAVSPPRRALVRVMAAGDVEELLHMGTGLQVLPTSHPTPGSTAGQPTPSPTTSRQTQSRSPTPSPSQAQKQQHEQQQKQGHERQSSASSQAPILSRVGSAQSSQTRRAWAQDAAVAAALGAAAPLDASRHDVKPTVGGGDAGATGQPSAGSPGGIPALLLRPLAWLTGTLRDAGRSARGSSNSLVTAAPQPGPATPVPAGALGAGQGPPHPQPPDRAASGRGSGRWSAQPPHGGGWPAREGGEGALPGMVPEDEEGGEVHLGPEVEVLLYTAGSPHKSPPQTPCRRRVTAHSGVARRSSGGAAPATWQAAAAAAMLPVSPGPDRSPPPPPRSSRLSSGGGRSPRSPRVLMPALCGAAAAAAAPSPAGSATSGASGGAAGPWWHLTPLTPPWQLFHPTPLDPAMARAGGGGAEARAEPSRAAAAAGAYDTLRGAEQGARKPPAASVAELVSPTRDRRCASDGSAAAGLAAAAARQAALVAAQQAAARQAVADGERRHGRSSSGSTAAVVAGGGGSGGAGPSAAAAQHRQPHPPQQPHRSPTEARPAPGLSAAAVAAASLASPRVAALRGQGAGPGGDAADVVKSPRRALLMPHPRAATPRDS